MSTKLKYQSQLIQQQTGTVGSSLFTSNSSGTENTKLQTFCSEPKTLYTFKMKAKQTQNGIKTLL